MQKPMANSGWEMWLILDQWTGNGHEYRILQEIGKPDHIIAERKEDGHMLDYYDGVPDRDTVTADFADNDELISEGKKVS